MELAFTKLWLDKMTPQEMQDGGKRAKAGELQS